MTELLKDNKLIQWRLVNVKQSPLSRRGGFSTDLESLPISVPPTLEDIRLPEWFHWVWSWKEEESWLPRALPSALAHSLFWHLMSSRLISRIWKRDLEVNLHCIHIFKYENIGLHVDYYWQSHDYISNQELSMGPGSDTKESTWNEGDVGSIPGLGRFPWRKAWQPTPVLAWKIPIDREPWRTVVHGVAKSWNDWETKNMGPGWIPWWLRW